MLLLQENRREIISPPLAVALPDFWVRESPPSSNIGIDFVGRLNVKDSQGKMNKAYKALFSCYVTGAVHLEFPSDLSIITFINCFHRLCARRVTPKFCCAR